jgi:hypothetical protein
MMTETLQLAIAYRAVLQRYLEPGQKVIWHKDTRSVEVVTEH